MILPGLLSQQITILTAGQTTDAYGNTVSDWTVATSRTVAAYVRPTTTSVRPAGDEYVDTGTNIIETAWQVHTNDLDVGPLDRVVFDGEVYEVDGRPLVWKADPRGRQGFSKFGLRRVDG